MQNAPSRRAPALPYRPEGGLESIIYKPAGRAFTAEFFPALGENFPTIKVECQMPSGNAPERSPIFRSWRSWVEFSGSVYAVLVAEFSQPVAAGNPPGVLIQNGTWLADATGKILASSFAPEQADVNSCARRTLLETEFAKASKPLPATAYKTTLGEVNLVEMAQTWTASIAAPGIEPYQLTGDAQAIRKAGGTPEKYEHFKAASTWQPAGSPFAFLVAETADSKFHAVGYRAGKQAFVTIAPTLGTALLNAEDTGQRLIQNA